MKYSPNKTIQNSAEQLLGKNSDFPMHNMGEDFFVLTKIEDADPHYFNGIHRHDFYEVLWFTNVKPKQVHYIDFVKYPIMPNQLFLLLPDQIHNIDKKDKVGYMFAISKEFFERLIAVDIFKLFYHTLNFSVCVSDEMLPVFLKLMELIAIEDQGAKRPSILESYLRSWFLHCIELQKEVVVEDNIDSRMNSLIAYVEENFKEQRSASFYADALSLSAKRLNELTKESFGKTISQLVNDRLILEAKREISSCDKSIKEISYELGFSEPAYFTRFFGKQTGNSPEDFRKKITGIFN